MINLDNTVDSGHTERFSKMAKLLDEYGSAAEVERKCTLDPREKNVLRELQYQRDVQRKIDEVLGERYRGGGL